LFSAGIVGAGAAVGGGAGGFAAWLDPAAGARDAVAGGAAFSWPVSCGFSGAAGPEFDGVASAMRFFAGSGSSWIIREVTPATKSAAIAKVPKLKAVFILVNMILYLELRCPLNNTLWRHSFPRTRSFVIRGNGS
jgi:hypothetical protein